MDCKNYCYYFQSDDREDFTGKHTGSHSPAFIWGVKRAQNHPWGEEKMPPGLGDRPFRPTAVTAWDDPPGAKYHSLMTGEG